VLGGPGLLVSLRSLDRLRVWAEEEDGLSNCLIERGVIHLVPRPFYPFPPFGPSDFCGVPDQMLLVW
jgi:hypothetical protein